MKTVDIGEFTVGDGHPPRIMGVLNMSIESNWSPSVAADEDSATDFAWEMIENGADIIDIGLQSANPKNEWLPPEVELERLEGALSVIDHVDAPDDVAFSLETRYAEVAAAGLDGGFDVVNDVCGFADPEMPEVCRSRDAPVIKMASPPDIRQPGHVKTIDDVFAALQRDGFTDKTIIDPAFGGWFAEKTFEDNWEMFRRLREFRAFGRPILTATNREDFLGDIAGKLDNEEQLYVSLAAATLEVDRGAHIVRTHDVPETADVVKVAHHLDTERVTTDAPRVVELQSVTRRELERFETVADVEPGTVSEAALYCFQIDAGADEVSDGFVDRAVAGDVGLLVEDDRLLLAGTHEEMAAFVDEIESVSGVALEVAGSIRRALTR